jgi:hypothetical protein
MVRLPKTNFSDTPGTAYADATPPRDDAAAQKAKTKQNETTRQSPASRWKPTARRTATTPIRQGYHGTTTTTTTTLPNFPPTQHDLPDRHGQ